ncbi:MAG: hypothetical protein AMXMBFR4_21000 [Candidatus Hydrogenedentota bacterium]
MNYAAAIGDDSSWYFDDEREDGIIAPPMLSVALTWPFGQNADRYWDPEKFPLNLLVRQVHYTEQLVFERLLRPGDKLTINADLPFVTPHRAGTLVMIRCRAKDAEGRPVFTEYAGTLLRGVRCTDKGTVIESPPEVPKFRNNGPPLWENVIPVSPLAAHIYDGCADIFNPIHTSKQFAKWVGLPGTILHGTCTLAWAVRDVVRREAGGDPRRVRRISCRFTGMVLPGTSITTRALGKQTEGDTEQVFFEVLDEKGRRVLSEGLVEFRLR